jgi:hypothetical protein
VTFNHGVVGSSPTALTNKPFCHNGFLNSSKYDCGCSSTLDAD